MGAAVLLRVECDSQDPTPEAVVEEQCLARTGRVPWSAGTERYGPSGRRVERTHHLRGRKAGKEQFVQVLGIFDPAQGFDFDPKEGLEK